MSLMYGQNSLRAQRRTLHDYQTMQDITFSILLWFILRSRKLRGRFEGMLVKLLCCRYKRSSPSNFRNAYKNDVGNEELAKNNKNYPP